MILAAAVVAVALGVRALGAPGRARAAPRRLLGRGGRAVGIRRCSSSLWDPLLDLFGKSEDLTGRFDIWASVTGLAAQRPWFGWGWVGYWAPWVEPFDDLAVRKGVTYLQAHNAWLDVWLQLGIVGRGRCSRRIVIGTLWRCWFLAVDRPRDALGDRRPMSAPRSCRCC